MLQNYISKQSRLSSVREKKFTESSLGKLKQTIPLEELAKSLPVNKNPQGAKPWLDKEGMIALMFLKTETGMSDAKLIENLNANWQMQEFCGIKLEEHEEICDQSLPSRIRSYLSRHLNMVVFQKICVKLWEVDMQQTGLAMMDATVYESYIKFPTDVKLLWDCCQFLHSLYERINKEANLKKEKNSFKNQAKKQHEFSLTKKKSYRKKKRRRAQLLKLMARLQSLIDYIMQYYGNKIHLSKREKDYIKTIKKIAIQQQFLHVNPGEKVEKKIVSLYKPYVRPIVRGKENKPVEFGIKVHMMQVDGINIIEHYSYEAYNECKRLQPTVELHKELFENCNQVAADRIYATNENRKYLNQEKIAHNFVPKGKGDTKEKKQLREILNNARSTILEGSFGNEKNHYGLRKIKARNQANETLWIFFGVMTTNAIKIAKRKDLVDEALKKAA